MPKQEVTRTHLFSNSRGRRLGPVMPLLRSKRQVPQKVCWTSSSGVGGFAYSANSN